MLESWLLLSTRDQNACVLSASVGTGDFNARVMSASVGTGDFNARVMSALSNSVLHVMESSLLCLLKIRTQGAMSASALWRSAYQSHVGFCPLEF